MSKIYYWEKLTFSKLRSSRKKKLNKALALKSKKVQDIFGETFILALSCSAVFCLESPVSDFFLIRFAREIKGFLTEFLRKWVRFHKHNERFLNIFSKKPETWFFRWKSNDCNNINIFLSLENPCGFLLA